MRALLELNAWLNGAVWGWPMLLLLVAAGIFFSARTRFVQVRSFGKSVRLGLGGFARRERARPEGVTPTQAMTTALAATVGTGNIAGVAGALALGGPGAVFWMWVSAFLGMATKYAEIALSVRLRVRDADGRLQGGPMYYMRALGRGGRALAVAFSLFGALAAFGIGNTVQANTLSGAVCAVATALVPAFAPAQAPLRLCVGVMIALVAAPAIMGGAARIGRATERLVPVMSALYALAALAVIVLRLPDAVRALGEIFARAFTPHAALGGAVGAAIRCGMERGMFSHEAGMGSAPIAHALAAGTDPDRQGLLGVFEVFADTIVMCTLTALAILASGARVPYGEAAGAELTIAAFSTAFGGGAASLLIAVCVALFALSTLLSWSLYGERCFAYLTGGRLTNLYKGAFVLAIVLGSVMRLDAVWALSGTLNALMAVPNLVAMFPLSGVVARISRGDLAASGKKREAQTHLTCYTVSAKGEGRCSQSGT